MQLYVQAMDRLKAKPMPGTEDGWSPFFSPDGICPNGHLVCARITTRPYATTRARLAFEGKKRTYLKWGYDVAPDSRFVVAAAQDNQRGQLDLVQNLVRGGETPRTGALVLDRALVEQAATAAP